MFPWLKDLHLFGVEILIEIEEAIAVTRRRRELVDHDRLEERADVRAAHVIFRQAALKCVDRVHAAGVGSLQLVLHLHVAGDLREACDGFETQIDAQGVVTGDAIVPATLHVAGDQILPALAAVAEKEIADAR